MRVRFHRRKAVALITGAALCAAGAGSAMAITASGDTVVNATVNEQLQITTTPLVSFPALNVGDTSAPQSAPVNVVSNVAAGYQLSVNRTVFTNGDIPLYYNFAANPADPTMLIDTTVGTPVPVPTTIPAFNVGHRTNTISPPTGDNWDVELLLGPVPFVASGAHSSTVTFTAVGLP